MHSSTHQCLQWGWGKEEGTVQRSRAPLPCHVFPGPQLVEIRKCLTVAVACFLVPGSTPGLNRHSVHKCTLNEFNPKLRPPTTVHGCLLCPVAIWAREDGEPGATLCASYRRVRPEARVQGETWSAGGPCALTEDVGRLHESCLLPVLPAECSVQGSPASLTVS